MFPIQKELQADCLAGASAAGNALSPVTQSDAFLRVYG